MSFAKKAVVHGLVAAASLGLMLGNAQAADVNIKQGLPYVSTVQDGKVVKIERIQDQNNVLTGGFSKTSRKCPPFCIQPVHVAPGVTTVGELELLDFVEQKVNTGTGILIDARTPSWHKKGTIPGSINIPFTHFGEDQSELVRTAALTQLGVRKKSDSSFFSSTWDSVQAYMDDRVVSDVWDFSEAKEIMLWCNGMWCGQSPAAIHNLLDLGYPANKIHYYRGGMQDWQILGLTVVVPEDKN